MAHHEIGSATYSVNEHGCRIEHTAWQPSRLDEFGRCCGRKPHEYKTAKGLGGTKDRHFCCFKCNREYRPDGTQRPNWAFKLDNMNIFTRNRPMGLASELGANNEQA